MSSQRAPGQLELVRRFVNTHDLDEGTDEVASPRALARWLADAGLLRGDTGLDEDDLRRAHELREALRGLMLANNGAPLDPRAVETLNAAAAGASVSVRFDSGGNPELAVEASGLDAAIARLASIVYEAKVDGTWPRLKACPADDCHWAFYDHSRNRSGTWCSMRVCGNRAKVRAFRERRSRPRRA
jgi:predicted RNA-binding Zn ribbon-like protein